MTTTLDIAGLVSAIVWPGVIVAGLLIYRSKIPLIAEWLSSRVKKLEFAGVSLEFAVAKPFVPDWSPGTLDLRHSATYIQINDRTAASFLEQLKDDGKADYAEVNLGTGQEWLTSRLFIMAIVFARMKGIKGFVFVETSENVRKRYVGWAEPQKIRWALAKQFSWLEESYAGAYSTILSQKQAFVVTNGGKLGSTRDPGPSIELLREFLQRVQALPTAVAPPVLDDPENWVPLETKTLSPYEHASWINSETLEQMLGSDLNSSTIKSSELRSKNSIEQTRTILSMPGKYVAVTGDDQRFEYLIDRHVILELIAKRMPVES